MYDLNQEYRKGILFIRVSGEITYVTSNNFYNDIDNIIRDNGIKNLVLNLDNVKNIDNIGKEVINKIGSQFNDMGAFYICNAKEIYNKEKNIIDNELKAIELIEI